MDNQSQQQGTLQGDDMKTWIFVWIFALAAFTLVLICAPKHRRRLWLQRLKERRWNVTLDEENDGETQTTSPQANRTSEAGGNETKPQLSKQDETEIRQLYLVELLSNYSKQLGGADLKRKTSELIENDVPNRSRREVADATIDTTVRGTYGTSADDDDRLSYEFNNSLPAPLSSNGFEDIETTVVVPLPGVTFQSSSEAASREVPNGCSICFCEYVTKDRVTWASNPECSHVFHEDCALKWFMAVGKKELRRRRREGTELSKMDPVEQVKDFPIVCPCCRQTFVSVSKEEYPKTKVNASTCLSDCPTVPTIDSCPSTTEEGPNVFGDENV